VDDVLFIHMPELEGTSLTVRVMHDVVMAQGILERLIVKARNAQVQDTIAVPFDQFDNLFGSNQGRPVFIFPWHKENFACMPLRLKDATKYIFVVVEKDGTFVVTEMGAHKLQETDVRVLRRSFWNI